MPRARDLGIVIGSLPTGPTNSVLDVAGVGLGHATLLRDEPPPPEGRGLARTGVSVLVLAEDAFTRPLPAGGAVLNGAGECTGFITAAEWGSAETPVYLTSTLQLGRVYDSACRIELEHEPVVGDRLHHPGGRRVRRLVAQRRPPDAGGARGRRRGLGGGDGVARVADAARTRARSAPAPGCRASTSRAGSVRRPAWSGEPHRRRPADDQLRLPRGVHRERRAAGASAGSGSRRLDSGSTGDGRRRRLLHRDRGHRRAPSTAPPAPGWRAGSGSGWPAPARWPTTAAARSSWPSAPGCGSTATGSPTAPRS